MNIYYILEGHKPIKADSPQTWSMWFDKADRIVKETQIDTDEKVSTVFLGINLQPGDDPPLLFETMVFKSKFDGEQYRYSTWDEAVEGHNRVVKMVMAMEK